MLKAISKNCSIYQPSSSPCRKDEKFVLYDIAFLIFSVFYIPALFFKGKLEKDFLERFGIYDDSKRKILESAGKKIWIQAVSVGEIALCRNFILLLKERFPEYEIIISTITKAGRELAERILRDIATIIYFPVDFSSVADRVVNLIRPKVYIMVETEIWPNQLRALSRRGIPAVLINGRISDKSFGRYKLARIFLKNILDSIYGFYMQSSLDAARMIELGAPPSKVKVTGNMKFDIAAGEAAKSPEITEELLGIGPLDELLVGGSTHRGEEAIVIGAYEELLKEFSHLKLLIAPRHIERVGEVESLIKGFGFKPIRVSSLGISNKPYPPNPILVLDTIGQLNDIYSLATLVFVGGSLVRHGGQNPIEPAILEKAILFGPYMFNFKMIASAFLRNRGAIQVSSQTQLLDELRLLLKYGDKRSSLGRNAKRVVLENRGATERNLATVSEILR